MPVLTQMLLLSSLSGLEALSPGLSEGEIEIKPSEASYVAAAWSETFIRKRPWMPSGHVATVGSGTSLVVLGEVESRDKSGCKGKNWYAIHPFGFVCSTHVKVTDAAPDPGAALPVDDGKRLPFAYAFVRTEDAPMYASSEDASAGISSRSLEKGMSLVVARTIDLDGEDYVMTRGGKLVAKGDVRWGGQGSTWSGVTLEGEHVGPSFAWVASDKTVVRAGPGTEHDKLGKLDKRTRVPLLESVGEGDDRWWRIGPDRWIRSDMLNEVVFIEPPPGVLSSADADTDEQWIDVNVGEQVLVAYRGRRPVYATMISSGKNNKTPLGNYPIWAKVASMDMSNQDYEDNAYMVQGVPWVLLFQGHNALHGAYWHDSFGRKKSHGCVNLSPLDARFVFEWVAPTLPRGWTGYLPESLQRSVVVHVRDTDRPPSRQFDQQRPIGPPDREAERLKTEQAQARREAEAASELYADGLSLGEPGEPGEVGGSAERIEAPAPPSLVIPRTPPPVDPSNPDLPSPDGRGPNDANPDLPEIDP